MFKAGQQHKICTVKHSLFELWSDKEVRERRENVGRSDRFLRMETYVIDNHKSDKRDRAVDRFDDCLERKIKMTMIN